MAKITCSISGLELQIPHVPMFLSHTQGYTHPIFYLKHRHLLTLYKRHCSGSLTSTESYLLFLALLNSTGQVKWRVPATLDPNLPATAALIERNIRQLIEVIELTSCIQHPSFKQPSYIISLDTCNLSPISGWISAWHENIERFKAGRQRERYQQSLQATENKLSHMILSGIPREQYAGVVANWAAKAGEFPKDKAEDWKKIIRSTFSKEAMFNTPPAAILEIKDYCEQNIPAGSIHFHALMVNLREGLARHNDYLGIGIGAGGYTLLNQDSSTNDKHLAAIVAKAPVAQPTRVSHPDPVDFLRATLAWKIAAAKNKQPVLKSSLGDL